jgi:CRP-like cAMP-binding protein
VDHLDEEIKQNGHFHDLISKYSHALLIHEMRTTACNGLHSLQQRCARWMLTTLDRIDGDQFTITHDLLASLLGSHRPSVSLIVEEFEKRGIVRLQRGQIAIANRAVLEDCVCECYGIIKETFRRVGI